MKVLNYPQMRSDRAVPIRIRFSPPRPAQSHGSRAKSDSKGDGGGGGGVPGRAVHNNAQMIARRLS